MDLEAYMSTIQEMFSELGVEYVESGHRHARPGWINIDCPFCGRDSKKFHMGFNLNLHFFHCWRCRSHHPAKVLRALGVASESRAKEILRGLGSVAPLQRERSRETLKEPDGRGPLLSAHRRYLRERGFEPEIIQSIWKIEGIGIETRRLAWRIYIPIYYQGRKVSWTSRAIGAEVEQRYLSASAADEVVNHKSIVYGADLCRQSIVICEGPLDAWAIGPGAGSLFGTAFSDAQVAELVRFPYRYVCFDASLPAQSEARKLCAQLATFPGVTENLILDAKDPAEASEKELNQLRRIARLHQ